jgi:hypothetical protein
MNLELLPNEIFLDLFEYFNGTDLYGLNSRFNLLLYNQLQFYYFNFTEVSIRCFDLIGQQHFPFIANRIIALSLSEQIHLFFSYIQSSQDFTHLQLLILFNLQSYEILLELLDKLQNLGKLTHLNFYFCSFPNFSADYQLMVDRIWNLPKLTHCCFDIDIEKKQNFYIPTIISASLEYLFIFHAEF